MKNEYRILEYKHYFVIERKYIKVQNYFLYTKKVEKWKRINLDGGVMCVRDLTNPQNLFKTKEEALQGIADLEKYPIYHYVN